MALAKKMHSKESSVESAQLAPNIKNLQINHPLYRYKIAICK